jgi:hypothetical protein
MPSRFCKLEERYKMLKKIKITKDTIDMFSHLKNTLGETMFRENINMQLADYDITPEFIEKFKDDIDTAKLSASSISKDIILALGPNFDFEQWANHNTAGDYKDIGILMDDDFANLHSDVTVKILETSKNITQEIFNKYFSVSNGLVQANFLLHYEGPEVDYDKVSHCIGSLGARFFEVPYVKKNVINDEKKIDKLLSNLGVFSVDMPFVMTLMTEAFCPNEIMSHIDSMTIKDTSSADIMASGNNSKYTEMVHYIIQKYPNAVLDKFMPILYQHMPDILKNSGLLKEYLVYCDNIAEDTLIALFPEYVFQGLREEIVTYAKNYGYSNLLVCLKLGS